MNEDFINFDVQALSEADLIRFIEYHNRCYWEKGEPEIPDERFNELFNALKRINPKHPFLVPTPQPNTMIKCPCCGHKFTLIDRKTTIELMEDAYVNYDDNQRNKYNKAETMDGLPDIESIVQLPERKITVCFTGFHERDKCHLKAIALKSGLILRTGVTKDLKLLVCGATPGPSKLAQAKEQDVAILNFEEFEKQYVVSVNSTE